MKLQFVNRSCVCLAVLLSIVSGAFADPPAGHWALVWSDEFDSGSTAQSPNSANWSYESGYVRNQEWQYYTNNLQNAYCQNGFLHIEAHKHPAGTYPTGSYTGQDGSISSASLKSYNKVDHMYGWLEMRARIDTRWGSWPAFWTLGKWGQWPDNGECDIMEYYRGMLKFNVAWWKTGDPAWTGRWDGETVYVSSLPSGWENEFHVWAMEWTPEEVKLYMDGVLYNTWDSSQDDNGGGDTSTEGFQQPHYILLNQAIGGTAGGDASGLSYPTSYEIDYVRWYQVDTTVPTAPTGLVATAGDGFVTLDWTGNTELDLMHYDVYRSTTSGSGYVSIYSGQTTSDYVDNSVTNGTTYYYVVTATDTSSNESSNSNQASATPEAGTTTGPITVVNSSFELPGTTKQTNWGSVPGWSSDTVASESGVETGGSDGSWQAYLMGSDPAVWQLTGHVLAAGQTLTLSVDSMITWLGTNLTMTLYYDNGGSRVTAATQQVTLTSGWQEFTLTFNVDDVPAAVGKQVGILLDSPTTGADWIGVDNVTLLVTSDGTPDTTPPAAPTGLAATAGDGAVSLDWADNGEGDLADYDVYRSTTSGSGYASVASGVIASDYIDNTVVNGTTYYYVVTATDTSSNESAYSNEDSATPQAGLANVIDAWILSGQSNAEGYAITESPVSGLAPSTTLASIGRSDLNMTHSNVRMYNGKDAPATSAGMTMSPRDTWHAMLPYEGLAYDWGTGRGNESGRRFGPELAFAYDMQQDLGAEIAMIKYARSSASIAPSSTQESDGAWIDFDPVDSRYNQYDKLITTIGDAVAALAPGDILRIQGVLWMQGEQDATNSTMAAAYEANLTEFISVLRSDLSVIAASSGGKMVPATHWDDLKFFVGTIYTQTSNGNTVRAAQSAVAAADPDVYIVDGYSGISMMTTDDWGMSGVHYDTAGQVLLGERFAGAVVLSRSDLTGDGKVDLNDVARLGTQWQNGYEIDTLLEIANNWLYGTSP